MGIDIAGATIVQAGGGIVLNNALAFNSAGQGTANPYCGFNGYKSGGVYYYSAPTGWEFNTVNWSSGLNTSNGVFTCPVAGIYAIGYNGLHRGGSGIPAGFNTYGYAGFAKNGVLNYFVHWNQSTVAGNAYWNTGGTSALFSCQAGDTLALFVNRSPTSVAPDVYSQNYGLHPDGYSAAWCKLVG